jgi:putative spermidine/putrescine transport system substrate-binding protein
MKIRMRAALSGVAALTAGALTVGAALTGVAPSTAGAAVSPSKATSAAAFGGMASLIKAAKKEGTLNVITLPADWANYGNIIKDFEKKYGIKITSENPDGTSAEEITAVQTEKGQSRAPDVLDLGTSFAISAASEGLLAPYKVQSWSDIPATAKDSNGDWFDDYGGYVAIGYNSKVVKTPPTSFKSLLNPIYKNQIALNGNPTQAGAAFAAVYAAALANGGSFSNIAPGIAYFKKLSAEGNFVPVTGSESTVESGQTPILIWWDYLEESEVAQEFPGWKVVIPTDGHYAAYYSQAISATAPDPAAARLWEEYLYSTTGQNLWLQGSARPIELATLVKNGTADKTALAALPKAPAGTITFPSVAQTTAAETLVSQDWASAIGG